MIRFLAVVIVGLMVSGCAYKPLKAPCSAEEGGVPMAYSALETTPSVEPAPTHDSCGPMKPI